MAVAAIEVGVWAGLELSPPPSSSSVSLVHRDGEASSRGFKEIEAEALLLSDYEQIGRVEIDGESFAVLFEASRAPAGTDGLRRRFCRRF